MQFIFKLRRQYTRVSACYNRHPHPLNCNTHAIFIIFITMTENDIQCQSQVSIQYNYWLEWQLIANHPPATRDNHRSVRNILWLGIGHHFLVMRPLTLPECPILTLGHICLGAGKRFGQKISCGAVLAEATSSPSWSSLERLCSLEHAGKDMGVLHW